jgi:hypothetical protein
MMKRTMVIAALATIMTLPLLGGCREGRVADSGHGLAPRMTVPSGTHLTVRLASGVSSETAHVGDAWSGVVVSPVRVDGHEIMAAGAEVRGTVTGAQGARRGSRAMLDVAIEEVVVDGRTVSLPAATDAVIAGSPRARNLGAIAGGAAAGALIGKAVGGDGKDAAIGGLIGGATATAVVAKTKGYQVVLKPGTVLEFTVSEDVAMR